MPDLLPAGDDQEHRDDEAPPPRCRACHRPISDPDSIATGLGRDCRARHTHPIPRSG
ncbi:DUF6011 domain-containing protein [Streptomyces sp. 8K308]|uniref:DUF6011 domain-containing protein n=1 Tax=Streptomyces sp. 8K308 TaxID=2530388 RepID=UPI001404F19B|nr:DUF6011 domain-containing protein [Streptomyces sp. 8K308]